jgi:hypothetical protein
MTTEQLTKRFLEEIEHKETISKEDIEILRKFYNGETLDD